MENIYYAGLDVHKETIRMSVFLNNKDTSEFEKTLPGDGVKAAEVLLRLKEKGKVVACYESGCMGFYLQRYFQKKGIECIIAATSKIPRKPGDRIKTDSRDSRNLAKLLRAGELTSIHIPTVEEETVRDYLRSRDDLKLDAKRTKQRLLKFILRSGYRYEGKSYWTLGHRKWMKNIPFVNDMQKETFESYYYQLETLEDKLRTMDERIEDISQSNRYINTVNRLRCFKGIDYLIALAVVCECGDFRRFASAESFMSYLGLVPSEYSSGGKRSQGGITKAGNAHLRRLLIEAAWHYRYTAPASKRLTARRKGQASEIIAYSDKAMRRLQKKFSKALLHGKTKQVAVTAVARELAGFIWGIMSGNIN
jgi:transposase